MGKCPHNNVMLRLDGFPYCNDCGERVSFSTYEDRCNRPSYYTNGNIETWDFIVDKDLNFLEGNIIKYIVRWRQKNGIEDLKKARAYLDKLIEGAKKR